MSGLKMELENMKQNVMDLNIDLMFSNHIFRLNKSLYKSRNCYEKLRYK